MNRKLTLFICASFILLFCFPSASTAAERREEIIRFDNDAPASIRFILDESGYQNVSIIHGAAIIREHYDERGMQLDWSMAALIIEQSGHRQFLGMQWVIGTKNVVIETNDMVGVDLDSIFIPGITSRSEKQQGGSAALMSLFRATEKTSHSTLVLALNMQQRSNLPHFIFI